MRPTLDIRPLTLPVRGPLATIAKVDAVTCQADHSYTPKGWIPAVRPLSRRNAVAALVAAVHASDHANAMETWMALASANANAMLAVALALPLWNRPGKVVEGWNMPTHADHGCRTMVEGAIVAEVARLTAATMATMEARAVATLEALEAIRVQTGKAMAFPTATPQAAPVEAAPVEAAPAKATRKAKAKAKPT